MRTVHAMAMFVACLGAPLLPVALAQEAGGKAGVQLGQAEKPAAQRPLTRAEQVQGAQKIVARGAQISRRVGGMLSEARKDADIIRITCLNDKLTQVNANLRNAQKRAKSLSDTGDPERRRHEYTVIIVLGRRFVVLDQESSQCVGQELFETGTTRVTTEIDASRIPDEDPSLLPVVLPPSLPAFPPPILTSEPPEPSTPQR